MKRILISMCITLVTVLTVHSQLTIEQCYSLARENYPLAKQYGLIEQSSKYTFANLTHTWLPQVTLSAQATYQNETPSFPEQMKDMLLAGGLDMKGVAKNQYRVQVDVNQKIFDGGKASSEKAITQAQENEKKAQTDVDLYGLHKRVNELFFGVLLMDDRIKQTDMTLEMLYGNLDKVMSHLKNGIATRADESMLRAEIMTVEQNKITLQWTRDSYKNMLGILIGEHIGDRQLTKPSQVEPTSLASNHPELRLIDAKIATIDARKKAINASVSPTISAFGQAFYGYPGYNSFENMLNRKWSLNAIVGIRASWSLSNLYDRKTNLNQLETSRQQAELQRDVFLLNNQMEASRENDDISRLRELIKSDATIVALRAEVRQAEESRLRNGVIDIHKLVERITDENIAAQTKIIHDIELLKTIYDLKNTINQ